jgi:uncharacterized membrane protein
VTYDEAITRVVQVVEAVGVSVMTLGGGVALAMAVPAVIDPERRPSAYQRVRRDMGRVILLGLEILIIGDIVRTVVVEPTFESVLVLGTIVVIRIVLSFALEVEMDGHWPWNGRASRRP